MNGPGAGADGTGGAGVEHAGGDFKLLVTRMGIQALIALGVIDNPVTREKSVNLVQARMIEADLEMLLEKTSGNLDQEEQEKAREVLAGVRARLAEVG